MPDSTVTPLMSLLRRLAIAFGALAATALIVYFGRDGYVDNNAEGSPISLLDAFYYSTVSVSTTGYGDIVPVTDTARLWTTVAVTPLRLIFLITFVGTTVELLTERSRQSFRIERWRSRLRDHTIVVGYGTKGRAAVETLLGDDKSPDDIVVVDTDRAQLDAASALGLVTITGNATRSSVLRIAGVAQASALIVATNRDDTAVLVTLTARELAPKLRIVAAVRESENVHLLRQSGANSVIVSAETAGRLLGAATTSPNVVEVVEDLLTPDAGFAISEREVEDSELGGSPRHLSDIVLAVVRGEGLFRVDSPKVDSLERGDRLLYVRKASPPDED
ncbi:potassium channel family protein [Pseudonocardia sp. KRD-184]|uniref:Potassium channel family protein n=1 Tax=Pseudonocardia oceani TaxID=2792013 RepID=A0ABS6UC55_9PSEU|nr:potassium channel family protein [Pseudonocardia oceani]MBW0091836.1 potassium channel family protein [Pseudonocardia oceani]MBW0097349.1 potassium channel family protein [Pseudonocardia oceani]MBW0111220.1 potassium channel family protein [Pseudonocardia oceani]MBW0123809.1 potassium channel family protein [Pseudonocardia oceani]MBW0129826.1 potassium channel family protein [Pseudonocardia oceani]